MNRMGLVSLGENHQAGDLGPMDRLDRYSYMHPKLKREVPGKVFLGKSLRLTGMEVSFQYMPPGMEIPFYHQHSRNEELYVFLRGKGQFQIDDAVFDVSEGSAVRVSPGGKRTWRNNSGTPLILMVVQARENSIDGYETEDGFGLEEKVRW